MSASRSQVEPQADLAETELEPVASELDAAGETLDQVWLRQDFCILGQPHGKQSQSRVVDVHQCYSHCLINVHSGVHAPIGVIRSSD